MLYTVIIVTHHEQTKYNCFGKSEVPLYTWKDEEALYLHDI